MLFVSFISVSSISGLYISLVFNFGSNDGWTTEIDNKLLSLISKSDSKGKRSTTDNVKTKYEIFLAVPQQEAMRVARK